MALQFGKVYKVDVCFDNAGRQSRQTRDWFGKRLETGALKFVSESCPEMEELAEAQLMSRIPEHENIVGIIGVLCSERPAFLLQYVENAREADKFLLTVDEEHRLLNVAQILRGVACALRHLHSLAPAIVHRDIAPRNVLVARSGDELEVRLCDFGLSRIAGDGKFVDAEGAFMHVDSTRYSRGIWGCPPIHTTATDVYMFGLLAWELVTAQPLFDFPRNDKRLPEQFVFRQGTTPCCYSTMTWTAGRLAGLHCRSWGRPILP